MMKKDCFGASRLAMTIIIFSFLTFNLYLSLTYADFETARRAGSGSDIATAERLFLEGRYNDAANEAERLIGAGSRQKDELYYIKGLSEMKISRFKDARDTFEMMLSKYPQSKRAFDAYTGIGDSYFLEGNINGAVRIYNGILNKFPGDRNISLIRARIGECNARLGKKTKSQTEFQAKEIPRGAESGAVSVQIAAFKNKRNADKLARKVSGKGYRSYVEVPAGSGDKLYRVKVGPFRSKEEAGSVSDRLKKDGYRNKICLETESSS